MGCLFPLQAIPTESLTKNGKRGFYISSKYRYDFFDGKKLPDSVQPLPCGRCMSCRLEKSRQIALRCVHESKQYEHNCFVTLTFSDSMLSKLCPLEEGGYSLVRKHTQDFMKRLRKKFSDGFEWVDRSGKTHFFRSDCIRVFGCGEYGDKNGRPHYHLCLFNCDFPDKVKWNKIAGFWHYNSDVLSSLWSINGEQIGHATTTDFSFETAAYVGRYSCKKVTGEKADEHYKGRLPEFPVYSLKPGLGKPWFDKYGETDVDPTDTCVARGFQCKVPRYYDKLREKQNPERFALVKELRVKRAKAKAEDNTFARLQAKEKCMNARVRLLIRKLEK